MVFTTLLFGLGNPILSDDALGLALARAVYKELARRHDLPAQGLIPREPPLGELAVPWPRLEYRVEPESELQVVGLAEAAVAGLALLDVVCGWDRVILMDSIRRQGGIPGDIYRFSLNDIKDTARITSPHDLNLPSTIEFGRSQGFEVPKELTIYAIEAEDVLTVKEALGEVVERAIPKAKEMIITREFS